MRSFADVTAHRMARRWAAALLALPPTLFLIVFYAYPIMTLFAVSLAPGGQIDPSGFFTLVTNPIYLRIFGFTIGQAALSTAITLALAIPTAAVMARVDFPGKRLLLSLTTLPFVLPTVVTAAAFSALIGEQGIVNDLLVSLFNLSDPPIQLERTLILIVIAHVFYNFPLALRLIASFWANQSPTLDEAAQVLGIGGWRLWVRVRLPLIRPAVVAAGLLVFIFCFTSFGVIVLLGGARFATIEVEIYRQATSLFNLPLAAALSIAQIGLMFVLMLVYTRVQRQVIVALRPQHGAPRSLKKRDRLHLASALGIIALLLFMPLLALVVRAFTFDADGLTLRHFIALTTNPRGSVLFTPPLVAVGNSLLFALVTTCLALLLGTAAAYALHSGGRLARWIDPLLMLPLATSAVTIGFGYLIALDEPPLNLRASIILIPIAHTLVAMPFVVRSVLPAVRAVPEGLHSAARLLGVSGFRLWQTVDLPLIAPGLTVGAVFAFTVSMGEFGASLFIARPDTPTIPIVIYRLLGQPGATNYGQALALSVILMGMCALAFVLIERARDLGGEF